MANQILVIDTETTGLDPAKNSLWQIGIYYVDPQGKAYTANFRCKPLDIDNITDEALQVCHTTKEELMQLPEAKVMYEQFRNFLLSCCALQTPLIWVGYNCKFDQAFVDNFLKAFDSQDSIWKYFRHHHSVDMFEYMKLLKSSGLFESESLRLEVAYKLFGISEDTAHDACQDSYVTYLLYQWATDTIRKGFLQNQKLMEV
jgi:DNA polymerase III epsilon subunit-like protein